MIKVNSRYTTFILVLICATSFFTLFESITDFWDIRNIALRNGDVPASFWDVLEFNAYGWIPWGLTALVFIRDISLLNLINTTRKKTLRFSLKFIAQFFSAVVLSSSLLFLFLDEHFFETALYLSITNFYKYILALLITFTCTLLIEAKDKYTNFSETIDRLKEERRRVKNYLEKAERKEVKNLSIKVGTQIKLVPTTDIIWIEADDYCVKVHTQERYYSLRESMKSLEKKLAGNGFLRTHRGAIINVEYLDRIKTDHDSPSAILNNGEEVLVARTRISKIKKSLNAH